LRFSQYDRSDGLNAFIITLGTTFVGNWPFFVGKKSN
jgi:hypothetical protein